MKLLFINTFPPSRFRSNRIATQRRPPRACDTSVAPTKAEIDKLFTRLTHVNKNIRRKACAELAETATDHTIQRLVDLLGLEDTTHRRAAVQALGMTGLPVVSSIVPLLRDSDNSTVRASCSKVLAAVALYFPESRQSFPDDAVDALEAALEKDPDPVTKIATVGCLGTLGSDVKGKLDVTPGNDRAVSVLIGLCGKTVDMAVGATAVGAVAQIGQNGSPERKALVIEELKKLLNTEDSDEESGFNYIRQMAASHLDQLEGGTRVPEE